MKATVKSADRVLDVFELLGRWGSAMSHTQMSHALAIPKSSLSQLLGNLTSRNYLEFSPADNTYRLGKVFSALASRVGQGFDLAAFAQPLLAEITAATNESSALNLLKGDQAEVVATLDSPHRLVSHMRLRDLAPLYATSSGKVLLAYLPDSMRDEYLSAVQLSRITPRTLTSFGELRRQINTARVEGVAYSFEEFTVGIVGIATAVLTETGFPAGALNVAIPTVRYSSKVRNNAIQILRSASRKLADQIRRADLSSGTSEERRDDFAIRARGNKRRKL